MMGWASWILLVISILLYLWSQTYNGKGPEAGFMGMLLILVACVFAVVGLALGCIWLGMVLR